MAETVDETVIKISAQLDQEDVKNIRGQLKELQGQGKQNAINLGFVGNEATNKTPLKQIQQITANNTSIGDSKVSASNDALNKTRKDLDEMLKIAKKEDLQKTRLTDKALSESEGKSEALVPVPKKKIKVLEPDEAVGSILEKLGGALTSASAAAALGGPIAIGIAALALGVKEFFDKSASIFDKRLQEDFQLAIVQQQLGKTPNEAYAFTQRVQLAGGNPQAIEQGAESFQDELLHGLSPVKAQLYAQAGIDLQQEFLKGQDDPIKFRETLFKKLKEKTDKYHRPALQGSILRLAGFTNEEQRTFQNYSNPLVIAKANELTKKATGGTKTGELNDLSKTVLDSVDFKGTVLATAAAQRARSQSPAGKSQALSGVKIDAATANIVAQGDIYISGASDKFNKNVESAKKQAEQQYGFDDVIKYIKGLTQPQHNSSHHVPKAPASPSGSYNSSTSN